MNKQTTYPYHLWLLLFLAIGFNSCRTGPQSKTVTFTTLSGEQIQFLDSTSASAAIIQDKAESFFEQIGKLDMSIQMRRNYPASTSRELVLKDYRDFLQTEVCDFSNSNKKFLEGIFNQVYEQCRKLSPKVLPANLRLIKTHANHYGSGVYYTREDAIVIPKYALEQANSSAFANIMLHELFHIYSRLHPSKREKLYAAIGFKSIGGMDRLVLPDSLKQRILLNPDGINYAQAIQVFNKEGNSFFAIPIIAANAFEYSGNKRNFFDYLQFDLFEIQPPYSRLVKVKTKRNGDSLHKMSEIKGFFSQIKDNTDYIIHPDEVLADNFMHLVLAEQDEKYADQFSEEGRQLLQTIKEIILAD
ncbi:MAG: hypothetical protein AAF990_07185 [Bacteroidota bacterium]